MFMSFKRFICVFMSVLCVAIAFAGQADAARSADSSDVRIVAEVEKFNKEKLHELQKYIEQIGIKSGITNDLRVLYDKLNNLVVSNIELALELNAPYNRDLPSPKIGHQLSRLFEFLDIISREYTQDTFTAEMRSFSIIKFLIKSVDQVGV